MQKFHFEEFGHKGKSDVAMGKGFQTAKTMLEECWELEPGTTGALESG